MLPRILKKPRFTVLTRECALPGRKVRSETTSNRKSVLKLDDPKKFSSFLQLELRKTHFNIRKMYGVPLLVKYRYNNIHHLQRCLNHVLDFKN